MEWNDLCYIMADCQPLLLKDVDEQASFANRKKKMILQVS